MNPKRLALPALFVGLLFVFLFSRLPGGEAPRAQIVQGSAFGTTYAVKFLGSEEQRPLVEALVSEVVDRVNRSMSTYHPGSELSRFNRMPAGSATVSVDLSIVLREAKRVHAMSGGAFDPTVGPLVDAWGFGPAEVLERPSEEVLTEAAALVGFEQIEVGEGGTLRKSKDGVRVDLSAIAKGYAVAEISRALSAAGVERHLVEVGGELQASGLGPSGPWRVGIERPQAGVRQIEEVVPLPEKGAMATSGNYRNFLTYDGRTVTHIVDPRSGQPVGHGLGSVSVIAEDCMTADALATALYVLGDEDGLAWAESRGVAALFLTVKPDGTLRRSASAAFEALVEKP